MMEKTFCLNCNKPTKYKPPVYTGKFCNNKCQHEWSWENVTKPKIFEGMIAPNSTALKKFLTERDGYFCSHCGVSEWYGHTLSLDIDHIDGNNKNHKPENLRLLCPNCHRITPTWGNKRRG